MLPFGVVETIGFMTPVLVAIVAYILFMLCALVDVIATLFGLEANHLPLDTLSRPIETNLRKSRGEPMSGSTPEPINYCLT